MLNRSINETLPRTVLTAGTTLLAALLLAVFGGQAIRPLALVMSFGITVGTLSSVFVASPVLLWLSRRGDGAAPEPPRQAAVSARLATRPAGDGPCRTGC